MLRPHRPFCGGWRPRRETWKHSAHASSGCSRRQHSWGAGRTQTGAGGATHLGGAERSPYRGGRRLLQPGEEGLQSRLSLSSCSPRVLAQLQAVREAHAELLRRVEARGHGLQEQLQLHQLDRETLLLDAWLTTKAATAESQDYGQDLEGVKVSHS